MLSHLPLHYNLTIPIKTSSFPSPDYQKLRPHCGEEVGRHAEQACFFSTSTRVGGVPYGSIGVKQLLYFALNNNKPPIFHVSLAQHEDRANMKTVIAITLRQGHFVRQISYSMTTYLFPFRIPIDRPLLAQLFINYAQHSFLETFFTIVFSPFV